MNFNRQKAEQLERFALHVFTVYLQSIAKTLSEGYFHWNAMFSAILKNDESFLNQQVEDMKNLYPQLVRADLIDGNIAQEYEITFESDSVKMLFKIYNDDGQLSINGKLVSVVFDTSTILAHLGLTDVVHASFENNNFRLVYSGKILSFYNFIVSLLVALASVALFERLRRFFIIQHYQYDGLEAIVEILSKKDNYTAHHSRMVANIALELGKILKLSRTKLKQLYQAGILHDIGKIAVPESILNKTGKLSPQEYEIIKIHPQVGAQIIEKFPGLQQIADIIKQHHERLDGSGYPQGLKDGEIDFLAQILAVADVYSALTDIRPYRKAYTKTQAIQIMKGMPLNQQLVSLLEEHVHSTRHIDLQQLPLKD